jgi:hypothetical protein
MFDQREQIAGNQIPTDSSSSKYKEKPISVFISAH